MAEYTDEQIQKFLKVARVIESGHGFYKSQDAEALDDLGLVEILGPGRYRLTEEGKRRLSEWRGQSTT